MDQKGFQVSREKLGKTQKQLSELLGTSLKAVQSFEQGWRKVPVHIERQILLLLTLQKKRKGSTQPCWVVRSCPVETRSSCPAWEYQTGSLCWFINGTLCQGKAQTNWSNKMKVCRKCDVFQSDLGISSSKKSSG